MDTRTAVGSTARWLAAGAALAAAGYASWAAYSWLTYGHPRRPAPGDDRDSLLDRFMPYYDVAERHRVNVDAAAAVTFEAARGVLAEVPGREIVMGALTQPWLANVVFRALPPSEFKSFNEPGYVKIVWTLRADAIGAAHSIFRTETRVSTTDPVARAKFRRYWSLASPGIILIRRLTLKPLKADAERRARALADVPTTELEDPEGSHV